MFGMKSCFNFFIYFFFFLFLTFDFSRQMLERSQFSCDFQFRKESKFYSLIRISFFINCLQLNKLSTAESKYSLMSINRA